MTNESMNVTGGPQVSGPVGVGAPKGKRVAADLIDLLIVPIVLGVLAGILLLPVPSPWRDIILVVVNVAWLLIRDAVFSPGRKMVGLKLVSTSGEKVTLAQAFIRNILIIVPFVLVVGYIIEIVFVFAKGNRLADGWAHTKVVAA